MVTVVAPARVVAVVAAPVVGTTDEADDALDNSFAERAVQILGPYRPGAN